MRAIRWSVPFSASRPAAPALAMAWCCATPERPAATGRPWHEGDRGETQEDDDADASGVQVRENSETIELGWRKLRAAVHGREALVADRGDAPT